MIVRTRVLSDSFSIWQVSSMNMLVLWLNTSATWNTHIPSFDIFDSLSSPFEHPLLDQDILRGNSKTVSPTESSGAYEEERSMDRMDNTVHKRSVEKLPVPCWLRILGKLWSTIFPNNSAWRFDDMSWLFLFVKSVATPANLDEVKWEMMWIPYSNST